MNHRKTLLAASVASCVFIHTSANAAPMLEEVVVTAQKREQSMQDVGISVTAMTGENMSALGISGSADIARFTPNLNITNITGEGNQPAIFLRGIGLNDFNTNNAGPVGMYVDEVIVSPPSAQAFALFDAARVEVLRGPQGTLYGRNSTGGSINVLTKRPTNEFEASADIQVGSFDQIFSRAYVNVPLIDDRLMARISAFQQDRDGYLDNLNAPSDEDPEDSRGWGLRACGAPDEPRPYHPTWGDGSIDSQAHRHP